MNLSISRILVPVDFSAHSDFAVRYATALASRLGASIDLLHVVEDPVAARTWSSAIDMPDLEGLREELVEEATRQLERCRAEASGSGVAVLTTVRVGQPLLTIPEYAKSAGVDLVIMGSHGRSGMAAVFMGSVAERAIRNAPCPVLTLHSDAIGDRREQVHASEPALLRSALGRLGTSRE